MDEFIPGETNIKIKKGTLMSIIEHSAHLFGFLMVILFDLIKR